MDVFTKEPIVEYQQVITVTPHIGIGTEQVFDQNTNLAINQIKNIFIY